jgi:hypothetical protein
VLDAACRCVAPRAGQDRNGANGSVIVTADYVKAASVWAPTKGFK